jgi:glycosyltransferase involved in cell wall biosynthesis
MRNEVANITSLLNSLFSSLDRSELRYELIIIDDDSNDGSVAAVRELFEGRRRMKLIKSKGVGKIEAIKTGLDLAMNDRIISLDADIWVNANWATAIGRVMDNSDHKDLVILPVLGIPSHTISSKYAALDFISLIGVTFAMAGLNRPIMANGAQLAYKKQCAAWSATSVSGDDIFLLHRIKEQNGRIGYQLDKDLIVRTKMPSNWRAVLQQRSRWASKTSAYTDSDTLVLGWYILILNVTLWVLFCSMLFLDGILPLFLTLLLTKMTVDLIFLFAICRWFGKLDYLKQFPWVWLLNSLMFPMVFVLNRSKGFEWKGRVYR